jgi:hypothetical protein
MAVVINEFEVVTGQAEQANGQRKGEAAQESAAAQPPPPPSPHEAERVIRRQVERYARLRAH